MNLLNKHILKSFFSVLMIFCLVISFQVNAQETSEDDRIFTIVEQAPTPVGGMAAFYRYVGKNIKYPRQAKRMGIQGRVFIEFVVTKTGAISNATVMRGIGGGCDEEALRIIQSSPKWTPGMQRGKPVNVKMVIPVLFKLSGEPLDQTAMPEGGLDAFKNYVDANTKYPRKAKKKKIEGVVTLTVSVNAAGEVTDIRVKDGLGYGLDEEAIRLVEKGPKWQGQINNGKKTATVVGLKIEFKLKKK